MTIDFNGLTGVYALLMLMWMAVPFLLVMILIVLIGIFIRLDKE